MMNIPSQITVSSNIHNAYDEQYTESISEWRTLGGKYKAQHIVDLCQRQGLKPRNVLEVGAGEGAILHHLGQWDFCDEMHALEISRTGVEFIQQRQLPSLKSVQTFDGYHIPFDDDTFDLLILSHVIEHVEFPRILLREILRVSTHQVIEIPCDYSPTCDQQVAHFMSYGHINVFPPAMFRFLLKTEGVIILDDLLSITDLEVVEYMTFVLENKLRTRRAMWQVKRGWERRNKHFRKARQPEKDLMANAYTLLCKKGTRPDIFK